MRVDLILWNYLDCPLITFIESESTYCIYNKYDWTWMYLFATFAFLQVLKLTKETLFFFSFFSDNDLKLTQGDHLRGID